MSDTIRRLVALVLIAFAISATMRFWYLAWFDPLRLKRVSKDRAARVPQWWPVPFREATAKWLESDGYLWYMRVVTTLGLLLSLAAAIAIAVMLLRSPHA